MLRPALLGFFLGILCDVTIWFFVPLGDNSGFSNFILTISTPAAHVVSWFTGSPMQQEAAILHYIFGVLLTFPVLGLLAGLIYGYARKYRQRTSTSRA